MNSESNRPSDDDSPPKVTVAVRDAGLRARLTTLLEASGIQVELGDPDAELEELRGGGSDVVLVPRSVLPDAPGRAVDELATDDADAAGVVVLSEAEELADRAGLVAAGASKVLDPSQPEEDLGEALAAVAQAEADGGSRGPEGRGAATEPRLADFYSHSPRMKEFLDVVRRLLDVDSPLLITGETGVGKERLARAIHAEGPRGGEPFVAVNVSAIPENLVESELFGHEKGAFTGAAADRQGFFEQAHGGTIFLDEIGDMPRHQQVKLLTVLQRHEVQRIGATRMTPVDVRVMAATNRDLWEAVERDGFREDLYYRLNVVPLVIPPLRERREDIPDLVGRFINHFRSELRRDGIVEVEDAAMKTLVEYDWPGNVRELINVIERAMLLSDGDVLSLDPLPAWQARREPATVAPSWMSAVTGPPPELLEKPLAAAREELLAAFEAAYLRAHLRDTRGRVKETAARAGIRPRSLYDKMKRHGLRKEDFKTP